MLTWGLYTLSALVFFNWALVIEVWTNDVDVFWNIDPNWVPLRELFALHDETKEKDCKSYETALTDLPQTIGIYLSHILTNLETLKANEYSAHFLIDISHLQ